MGERARLVGDPQEMTAESPLLGEIGIMYARRFIIDQPVADIPLICLAADALGIMQKRLDLRRLGHDLMNEAAVALEMADRISDRLPRARAEAFEIVFEGRRESNQPTDGIFASSPDPDHTRQRPARGDQRRLATHLTDCE